MKSRKRNLKLNTLMSILNRFVTIICGLILPRYILTYYGSDVNGLISSIAQFISFITFFEFGIGAVIQSALYKPLANDDKKSINLILSSAKKYFNKVATILIIYIVVLIAIFPLKADSTFSYFFTAILILSMSISLFAQYYFGIINHLLLNADQKSYIHLTIQVSTVILNTMVSIILIKMHMSIQVVKLGTAIIYLSRPVYLSWYVSRNYNIKTDLEFAKEPIKQKWNGFAQHLASVVLKSTDVVVLTLFSTFENVSVYTIHYMLVNGIRLMITSTTAGVQSLFGNMLAKDEIDLMSTYFSYLEWVVHLIVVLLFCMTGFLINSFVFIYTKEIVDTNYYVPLFALLLTISQAIYTIRVPYNIVVLAAGHYKQTQNSAIIEVFINIVLSVLLVIKFGIVGVAIGTLVAMFFRIIYFVIYLSNNIMYRSISHFFKQILVDAVSIGIMVYSMFFITSDIDNISEWISYAINIGVVFSLISVVVNYIFYKDNTKQLFRKILLILKR